MDQEIRELVYSMRGEVGHYTKDVLQLIDDYGLQAVATAEKEGFIKTDDNHRYYLGVAGHMLNKTTKNNDLSFVYYDDHNQLNVTFDRYSEKVFFNVGRQQIGNVYLKIKIGDAEYSQIYPIKVFKQFVSLLELFRDKVLIEDTVGSETE